MKSLMANSFINKRFSFVIILIFALQSCSIRSFLRAEYNFIDCYGVLSRTLQLDSLENVNLNGIQGFSLALRDPAFSGEPHDIALRGSRLDIYDVDGSLVDAEKCRADLFEPLPIQFFANMADKNLKLQMEANDFSKSICPYLFKNADLMKVTLGEYGSTHMYQNKLQFYRIKNPNNVTINLNAKISYMSIDHIYRNTFKRGELEPLVFASVKEMFISGNLAFFERDFFADFDQAYHISLTFDKTDELFKSSSNEWFTYMFATAYDFGTREEMMRHAFRPYFLSILQNQQNVYFYPDEDFCLFKYFPRAKAIYTILQLDGSSYSAYSNSRDTSCLYRFLSENNRYIFVQTSAAGLNMPDNARFDEPLLDECFFEEKLSVCLNVHQTPSRSNVRPFVSYYQILYTMKMVEFIGPIITFPLFSALGFILNLLVILIIRSDKNKKEKLFEHKSFRFIEMNSAFNCAECLVYQFRLMGLCLGHNSVFCSATRETSFQLYFGTVNVYLSEAMKSCSMMTGLLFSLQRYIEASQIKNQHLLAFSNMKMFRLFLCILSYGLVFSAPVIFNIDFLTLGIDLYDFPGSFFLRIELFDRQMAATFFYFLHYFVNDFLTLSLNLIIDCFLVREIKSNLRLKSVNMKMMTERDEASGRKDEKKRASVEKKANTMIILSVIIYLFCRVPELAGTLVLYFFPSLKQSSCEINLLCYLIADSIEYVYMISYIFNIFIYFKFNTFFNQGFRNYFGLRQKLTT